MPPNKEASQIRALSFVPQFSEGWPDARVKWQELKIAVAATLDRLSRDIRGIRLAQQAPFAFVDSLTKTLLTCIAEPPREAYDQAVARGKFRYDRFLKSVGAGMVGDSHAALSELLDRVHKD